MKYVGSRNAQGIDQSTVVNNLVMPF